MVGELVVREARLSDARAIAEVSVASRRWSYRDLIAEADLEALSVEDAPTDFAEGLAELSSGAAVFVAELTGRVVGYAYVLPSPDADVPAETSELGSLYVTEEIAGTEVAPALMDAAIDHSPAAGQNVLTLWVRRENGRARRFYEKHGMRARRYRAPPFPRRPADRDERDSLSNVALNPPNSTIGYTAGSPSGAGSPCAIARPDSETANS